MHAPGLTAPATIDVLDHLFEFREPDEVRAYLAKHPDLLDLLHEAATRIPEFLPPDRPIVLEMLWDPEDDDDEGELFAVVRTRSDGEATRLGYDRLLREWLVPAGRFAAGRFNVGIEYH